MRNVWQEEYLFKAVDSKYEKGMRAVSGNERSKKEGKSPVKKEWRN